MFRLNFDRDLVEEESCGKFIIVWCVYCVCVTCTYSAVDMHPSIRTYTCDRNPWRDNRCLFFCLSRTSRDFARSLFFVYLDFENLERKRGQYQDSWVFGGLSKRNVASKPRKGGISIGHVLQIDWFWLSIFHTNLVRGLSNKEMSSLRRSTIRTRTRNKGVKCCLII